MIPLLVIGGISLTASAVNWWIGRRTAKVQEQIDALENKLAKIHAADAKARRKLVGEYLESLETLVDQEIDDRNSILTELISGHNKAQGILKKRFGSREDDSFLQIVLELELALSRINAERAYLTLLKKSLHKLAKGEQTEIPSPEALQLPNDFPRDGGLVHFEGGVPQELHDYQLKIEDWTSEIEGRVMLFDVDHKKRVARGSATRAALLEANLLDGGGAIPAKVVHRDQEGAQLKYFEASLLLPYSSSQDYAWLTPESKVEVYPEIWTLQEITRMDSVQLLRVRTHPRIGGSKTYWSPILLSVPEAQLSSLVKAYERISDAAENAPWRIHLTESGQIAFSLGAVTLLTTPDPKQQAFSLDDVLFEELNPPISVRFHMEITAFVKGTDDDGYADRSLFNWFVEAIHAELSSQKQMLLQRRTALRLRKLSLIYQDQQEHLQSASSCGFLPGEIQFGGRVIIGTITGTSPPSWVDQAVAAGGDTRLRVVGHEISWGVLRISWLDRELGICKLELEVPSEATTRDINPFKISRLELAGEGSQQQILSKSLEYAILGKFTSARVHSTLLGLSGDAIRNKNRGRAPIERLLDSDEPVVAVWGPPGTGKTTLLVKWLASLFEQGREQSWPSVLIAAPTHVAVSKLLSDFLQKAGFLSDEVVRYCSAERIEGSPLKTVWHGRLLEQIRREPLDEEQTQDSWERWNALMRTREGRESATKWLLGPRHIHAATCVGMAKREYGLLNRPFDIAIIDEAGKAFGAELLLPASVARRVILVGDHNQLPPTVTSEVLDERIGYRLSMNEVEELLRRNMFHEIFEQLPDTSKGMLTKQYRMHKDIGDVVSELFYDGHLQSHRKDENCTLTSKRLIFVDFSKVRTYKHSKSRTSESIENMSERAALHSVLERINKKREKVNSSILVVCPYEAQRSTIHKEIKKRNYDLNVSVTTVDAVQGGEEDIVILLMTRSHGRVDFLLDRHRLNVALTRARDAVIVFGHYDCLTQNSESPIAKLIEIGLRNGSLDLVTLGEKPNLEKDIAMRIIK